MRRTHVSLMREMDVDPKLVAYAKLGLERRTEALELFASRLRGDASKTA